MGGKCFLDCLKAWNSVCLKILILDLPFIGNGEFQYGEISNGTKSITDNQSVQYFDCIYHSLFSCKHMIHNL